MKNWHFLRAVTQLSEEDFALAGEKAANQGALARLFLPTPEGYVLLSTAYERFLERNELIEPIKELLHQRKEEDSIGKKKIADEIMERIYSGVLPEEVQKEVLEFYDKQTWEAFALRSSVTLSSSYGLDSSYQYDSFLNVRGKENVLQGILQCYASLWSFRALAFAEDHRISPLAISMGVLFQELLEAEKSGLMFTANPTNNRRDEMLLCSSYGLGEAIVGGDTDVDQWVIEKKTPSIREKLIVKKEQMTQKSETGTLLAPVPLKIQEHESLTEEEVWKLYAFGEKVESHFGAPQDIEWSYCAGGFFLLQTRLLASLVPAPFVQGTKGTRVFVNLNLFLLAIQEPLTPMGASLMKTWLLTSSQKLFFGASSPFSPCLQVLMGRVFLDLSGPLSFVPLKDDKETISPDLLTTRTLIEIANADPPLLPKLSQGMVLRRLIFRLKPRGLVFLLRGALRVFSSKVFPITARSKAKRLGDSMLQKLEQEASKQTTLRQRVRFLEGQYEVLLRLLEVNLYLRPSSCYLKKAMARAKKHLEDLAFEDVAVHLPHNPITEMGFHLLTIARDLAEKKRPIEPSHPLIKEFLKTYGAFHALGIDPGQASWSEDPSYPLDLLDSFIRDASYTKGLDRTDALQAKAEEAIAQISIALRKKGVPRVAQKVEGLLVCYRETQGFAFAYLDYLAKALQVLRGVLLQIGEEIVKAKRLAQKEDVFFVQLPELLKEEDLKPLVEVNKRAYLQEKKGTAPFVILSTGEALYQTTEEASSTLQGVPLSLGSYEGKVRVLLDPHDAYSLETGEVLVIKSMTISVTPLLFIAGALLMETGGIGSLGASVARDYGIPAVGGLKGVTEMLKDGQYVEVQGEKGTVRLLD